MADIEQVPEQLVEAYVKGIPPQVAARLKKDAYANGVLSHPDGPLSTAIRWRLVQLYGDLESAAPIHRNESREEYTPGGKKEKGNVDVLS